METLGLILILFLAAVGIWIARDPIMDWALSVQKAGAFRFVESLDPTLLVKIGGILTAILGLIMLVLLALLILQKG